jgi:Ner family transcriptional regulator
MERNLSKKPTGWHRADILAEVRKRGTTLAGIARDNGLARQTLYWAMIEPRLRANTAIADFLDVPLNELWPQWFDENGKLISTERLRPRLKPMSARRPESIPRRRAA